VAEVSASSRSCGGCREHLHVVPWSLGASNGAAKAMFAYGFLLSHYLFDKLTNPANAFTMWEFESVRHSSTSLEFPTSPAAKRAAPAPDQDGGGGGANLPARRARSSSPLRSRWLSEPGPVLPHSSREEEDLELSPLRFKESPKQEEEEEFSVQDQSTPTNQGQIAAPLFSAARSRNRCRPSGWDVSEDSHAGIGHGAAGVTHHKPGAST
jgi:hypothetical protein